MDRSLSMARPLVLVVEDDAIQGLALYEALQEEGFAVLGPFITATEALAALERLDCPLVIALLDVQLQDGTAVPIAQRLSALGVASLVITGHDLQDIPQGLQDASGCLSKPLDMDELLKLMWTIIDMQNNVKK